MKREFRYKILLLLLLFAVLIFGGCKKKTESKEIIDEKGSYTSVEEVSAYIKTYAKLPSNYVTKKEAREAGWDASKGNLWEVTDRKSIGGDLFHNREGSLPEKKGRKYYEADIDYQGGARGPKRIVFSNDGLIYYTKDHYKNFEKIE